MLILGYKSAKEAAMVKHSEQMKQKQYEDSLGNTYRETFEYNPRQRQNEKMKKQREGSRITKQICPGAGTEKTKVSRFS